MPFLDRISGGLLAARAEQALKTRNAAMLGLHANPATVRSSFRSASPGLEAAAATLCAAAGCSRGWMQGWRNRRRPFFEDGWACSTRCLQVLVRSSIVRQMNGGAWQEDVTPHRHRVPLGLVLLAQGWITHAQLQAALQAQRAAGQGRIGDWLIKLSAATPEQISRGLAVQWNCPVLSLEGFSPAAMALVMPPMLAAQTGLIPVRTAGKNVLYAGFEVEMNAAAALALESMSGLRVESGLLPSGLMEAAQNGLRTAECVPVHRAKLTDVDSLCSAVVRIVDQRQPVASRIVRMGQTYWLRLWLETGAQGSVGLLPTGCQDMEDHLFSVAG